MLLLAGARHPAVHVQCIGMLHPQVGIIVQHQDVIRDARVLRRAVGKWLEHLPWYADGCGINRATLPTITWLASHTRTCNVDAGMHFRPRKAW